MMKFGLRHLGLFSLLLLISAGVFAQGTTATLMGNVTSDGAGLPGVTVTINSPAMQGTRTTITGDGGGYAFAALPPGAYTVKFELSGLQTVTRKVQLNLAQTSRADADLKQSAVAEAITVTAGAPSTLETSEVSTNFAGTQIAELPTLNRTIRAMSILAPGVNDDGPNNAVVISGAQSFDNLFLVNGVVVNENLRGQPFNLYIEDAVQETTVLSGGSISSEYGRFTGGVVSTITKSGGNEFSGSLRDSLSNDSWKAKTDFPGEADHISKINPVYEGTFGGRIIRDRLWFFTAGRKQKSSTTNELTGTKIPFTQGTDQTRYELKLTGQVTPKHSLVASYLDVKTDSTNNTFGAPVDVASLYNQKTPNNLRALHYNGILTSNLLVEGQLSEMNFKFVGGGALFRDRINGTLLRETATSRRFWSPTFCGVCRDKERNNKSALAKASYFLSTQNLGQHNFTGGWEDFHQLRTEDNYQSGSNYRLWGDFIYVGQQVYFHANPTNGQVAYMPLLEESKGSDFQVKSLFANDKWDLNSHLNFNIGIRYDKSNGKNQSHVTTVDDSAFSPRLGATYDLKGDGGHRFTASYSKYASKVDQGPADATSFGGRYASFYWNYRGPEINGPGTTTYVPTDEVIRRMFEWFDSVGGVNNTELINYVAFPGYTSRIGKNLTAPTMDEYSFGYGGRIMNKGYIRADLIHRNWNDFYLLRKDMTTGQVHLPAPSTATVDQGVIETGNADLERNYNGLQTQFNYRFTDRVNLGGNYTWSKLRGNVEGEEFNNATVLVGCRGTVAPGSDSNLCAPEYSSFDRNHPVGFLAADIRHRASLWLQYDLPTAVGKFNFSLLERYHSGAPYSAAAAIDIRYNATTLPNGIVNPGYKTPPSRVWYYFSDRGQYRLDTITSTDVAVNWDSPAFKSVRFFVQTDIINVLNEQGVEYAATSLGPVINQTVFVNRTRSSLARFNPYTTTPVEGVNYAFDPNFGKPTNRQAYQDPREYRVSVGVRF
jgi:hypothetical protein